MGSGSLDKKLEIAALKFTRSALEKITSSGGRALTLSQAVRENPEGRRTRVIV